MNALSSAVVPVSHSVIDPSFIGSEVARRYAIAGPVKAFLLYRGINDVYLIQAQDRRYALRVWRKTWREVDAVAFESVGVGLPTELDVPYRNL